jgi:hypothetical protein
MVRMTSRSFRGRWVVGLEAWTRRFGAFLVARPLLYITGARGRVSGMLTGESAHFLAW